MNLSITFDRYEEDDIRKAAELVGESLENFIFNAAVDRAEDVLESGVGKL